MLARIAREAENGTPKEKSRAVWKIFFLIFGIEAVALAASALCAYGVGSFYKNEELGMASLFLFIPVYTIILLRALKDGSLLSNCLGIISSWVRRRWDISKRTERHYGKVPHFGRMFKLSQVMDILESEEFVPYPQDKENKNRWVKVSTSDKWVCILGGYLPIDLICGYNRDKNEIYAIDGTIIKLPLMAKVDAVADTIEAFFNERGKYYKSVPEDAKGSFIDALDRPTDELLMADWGRVRYLWEKYIALNSGKDSTTKRKVKYHPVLPDGTMSTDIFERVLSKAEIAKTISAIRDNKVDFSAYMNFADYKNEFCVCNGIKLLESLKQPKYREPGMDFLFECLNDVDEAYFHMAVHVLKNFPREKVSEKIEEQAKVAYENYDVMKLGGLLFLAKELGYDIKYVKKLKEEAKAKGETVPGFDFDEEKAFGDDEVQRFSLGAYMYQKK